MSRVRLLLVVLLATLVAGCTGESTDDLQRPPSDDPVLVKAADDYSYLENETGSGRAHLHDYWGGEEALVVMDKTTTMAVYVIEDSVEVGKMRPDAGKTVLLGTERVEVTVEWEDHEPTQYGPVELWVKTAAMDAPRPVTEVQSGDMVTIESTNDDNDLPHQTLSGWEFSLVAKPSEADPGARIIWFAADVTMTAIAYRGLDIPLFPAHPDHWDGEDGLVLRSIGMEVFVARGAADGQACLSPCLQMTSPDDGSIVPPETGTVAFVVHYDGRTTQRLGWEYHGGDSWDWTELTPTTQQGNTYTYEIALDRGMADGPYAKQSLWEFRPFTPGRFDGVDLTAPTDGVFTGAYHVTITALRAPTA